MAARKRAAIALIILSALIILMLTGLSYYGPDYSGRTLVYPASQSARGGISVKSIEERNKYGGLLITYEIIEKKIISAFLAGTSVDIISTNYLYAHVTGYRMLSGGFFTEAAQSESAAQIILNEPAARELFGSFSVAGEVVRMDERPFAVAGVIDDESEEPRAYIIADNNKSATSLLVLCAENDAYVINELKESGVTQEIYNFTNIGSLSSALWGKTFDFIMAAAVCALIILIRFLLHRLPVYAGELKKALGTMYMGEVVKKRPGVILKVAAAAAAALLSAALIAFLAVKIFGDCISREAIGALKDMRSAEFRSFADILISCNTSADYLVYAGVLCILSICAIPFTSVQKILDE